jgi:hypothetical protein
MFMINIRWWETLVYLRYIATISEFTAKSAIDLDVQEDQAISALDPFSNYMDLMNAKSQLISQNQVLNPENHCSEVQFCTEIEKSHNRRSYSNDANETHSERISMGAIR